MGHYAKAAFKGTVCIGPPPSLTTMRCTRPFCDIYFSLGPLPHRMHIHPSVRPLASSSPSPSRHIHPIRPVNDGNISWRHQKFQVKLGYAFDNLVCGLLLFLASLCCAGGFRAAAFKNHGRPGEGVSNLHSCMHPTYYNALPTLPTTMHMGFSPSTKAQACCCGCQRCLVDRSCRSWPG